MNPDIYRRYTSRDNHQVLENLKWLASHDYCQKVTIRLPHIPDYNTEEDRQKSREVLQTMGFCDFDCFDYLYVTS